jgi:agmatine/peptidylarginine deiminase
MPWFVDDPQHWRERADEARAHARGIADAVAKTQMLEIASAYERMAERAEARLTGGKTQAEATAKGKSPAG